MFTVTFERHAYEAPIALLWKSCWSYLATVHYRGTVNNDGCQELPGGLSAVELIPPAWINSTNRHAHLIPLNPKVCGHVDWLILFKLGKGGGDKLTSWWATWQFLASIFVNCTTVMHHHQVRLLIILCNGGHCNTGYVTLASAVQLVSPPSRCLLLGQCVLVDLGEDTSLTADVGVT